MSLRTFDSEGRIIIIVSGPPPGKPRMTRRDKWMRRPCVMRYRSWCDRVREVAGNLPPAEKVLSLDWAAYFEPPKSWPKKTRDRQLCKLHRAKPDRDNVDKAVLDCLYPGGDSAIAKGTIVKRWGTPPRIEIVIVLEP